MEERRYTKLILHIGLQQHRSTGHGHLGEVGYPFRGRFYEYKKPGFYSTSLSFSSPLEYSTRLLVIILLHSTHDTK